MSGQTGVLTAAAGISAVTMVSSMVPNAIDSRPVSDQAIERAYIAAMTSTMILGLFLSLLAGSVMPFLGAVLCAVLVIGAHNAIQHNGLPAVV